MAVERIKIGGYTVGVDALRSAEWEEVRGGTRGRLVKDTFDQKTLKAAPEEGFTPWVGVEAFYVPATSANGDYREIDVMLDIDADGRSRVFVNSDDAGQAEDESGRKYNGMALAELVGHGIRRHPAVDVRKVAEEFVEDHPDCRFVLEDGDERTLYVCEDDAELNEAKLKCCGEDESDPYNAEVDREDAVAILADCLMDEADFEFKYGREKDCAAMFWKDEES